MAVTPPTPPSGSGDRSRVVTGTAEVADLEGFLDALDRVGEDHDCVVQAVDARYAVGPGHLRRAAALADRAAARGETVARRRSVEILLYAAGRRQIDRALTMGVSEGRGPVAVLVHVPRDSGGGDGRPGDPGEGGGREGGDGEHEGGATSDDTSDPDGAPAPGGDDTPGSGNDTPGPDDDSSDPDGGPAPDGDDTPDPGDDTPAPADRAAAAAEAVRALDAVDPGPVEFGDPDRLRDFFGVGPAELAATAGRPARTGTGGDGGPPDSRDDGDPSDSRDGADPKAGRGDRETGTGTGPVDDALADLVLERVALLDVRK